MKLIDRIKKLFRKRNPLADVQWEQISPWKFVYKNYVLRAYVIYFNRVESKYDKKKIVLCLSNGILEKELYVKYIKYNEDYKETIKAFKEIKDILKKFNIEVKVEYE
jgi:hypothetical protein